MNTVCLWVKRPNAARFRKPGPITNFGKLSTPPQIWMVMEEFWMRNISAWLSFYPFLHRNIRQKWLAFWKGWVKTVPDKLSPRNVNGVKVVCLISKLNVGYALFFGCFCRAIITDIFCLRLVEGYFSYGTLFFIEPVDKDPTTNNVANLFSGWLYNRQDQESPICDFHIHFHLQ